MTTVLADLAVIGVLAALGVVIVGVLVIWATIHRTLHPRRYRRWKARP